MNRRLKISANTALKTQVSTQTDQTGQRLSRSAQQATGQTGWRDRLDRSCAEPVQVSEFLPSSTLAQLQLGVVPLNMISNICLVPAHIEIAQPSRSKKKHKVKLEK